MTSYILLTLSCHNQKIHLSLIKVYTNSYLPIMMMLTTGYCAKKNDTRPSIYMIACATSNTKVYCIHSNFFGIELYLKARHYTMMLAKVNDSKTTT